MLLLLNNGLLLSHHILHFEYHLVDSQQHLLSALYQVIAALVIKGPLRLLAFLDKVETLLLRREDVDAGGNIFVLLPEALKTLLQLEFCLEPNHVNLRKVGLPRDFLNDFLMEKSVCSPNLELRLGSIDL